jgi:hypothetical protein
MLSNLHYSVVLLVESKAAAIPFMNRGREKAFFVCFSSSFPLPARKSIQTIKQFHAGLLPPTIGIRTFLLPIPQRSDKNMQ